MKTYWLVLLLLMLGSACHADRDIVYAARYYAPPGSHRTSHFHIYRINPDGRGKMQVTFGTGDEEAPQWSVDGRFIIFVASAASPSTAITLCQTDADGSHKRVLKTLAGSDYPHNQPVAGYRLENAISDNGDLPTQHLLITLKTGQKRTLAVPDHADDNDILLPMPGHDLVYAANNHNSTVGTDYLFYRLNPSTGTLHYLTEGQFLSFAPDGLHFCTAPGRDTTPYEKRKEPYVIRKGASPEERSDAQYRTVWFAPLSVRATSGGPMRQLTPRLSIVTGADWRKGT